MDAKKIFADLRKIPIIGDFIIAFAIIVVLITLSSAANFFGFEGDNKKLMINLYIAIGIVYFALSILLRIFTYFRKSK